MSKIKLEEFLKNYPLYKAFKIVENYRAQKPSYNQPYAFVGETFMHYCETEQAEKTFELELPSSAENWWGNYDGDRIPDVLFDLEENLNFVEHFLGRCKSCKNYKIELTLHVWSDNKIPKTRFYNLSGSPGSINKNDFEGINANIFIEKIGILPEQTIIIDSEIKKHFDRETNNWYFKANKCIQQNYGIGAFAYFRRIIEKELLTIVKEISELDMADSQISKLYDQYSSTNQVYSIYENIFEFLPKSLQSLGINPIKTLYNQTSEGLHSLSEQDCLARATSIDLLLKFVIKKINEEQSEILKVKEAIKNLR
ncbi:hypothetical protein [Flavobacterium sharifuzzamanii]|uniref:hypothetical protein n=1 Tax=Flavobacterium sharifuzzamanii TaxID=2211133 RepID=UPI000DAC747C|nr:hypothetical protein [Flavobacterium sharifuzzamanii]KAF2079446.1 hypothetical protein DMA14_18045 [Flavobacterium sharifuzzamanii]